MKISAALFAFLFLFLSLQSFIIKTDCPKIAECDIKESCCNKEVNNKKCNGKTTEKKESENTCNNGCNPFMPCAFCYYIISQQRLYLSAPLLIKNTYTIFTNQFILSSYQSDCWHPPELG